VNRIAGYVLVAALMVSIGAQWAVLQTAAWVGMAVTYSIKAGSVAEGLSQTFDGRHPCKLCCAIKKGTDTEKKAPTKQENTKKKVELFASEGTLNVPAVPAVRSVAHAHELWAVVRFTAPPRQPPRLA
jgi:hypothetical protein